MSKQEHRDNLNRALGQLVNDDALDIPTTIELLEELGANVQRELAVAREAADRQEGEGGA
jgi:hypothetical protein